MIIILKQFIFLSHMTIIIDSGSNFSPYTMSHTHKYLAHLYSYKYDSISVML